MQTSNKSIRAIALTFLLAGCKALGGDELGDGDETTDTSAGESSSSLTSTSDSTSSTSDDSTSSTSDDSTSSTSDDSTSDDSSSGETGNADCELNDLYEPNPSAAEASMMTWQSATEWSAYRIINDAYLCPGEGDWYHFDVDSLGYAEHFLYIRALIKDAGLCGLGCGDPVIPAGPQHAMTIEVYRAVDMQLLATLTQDDGVLALNGGGGDNFSNDLLIHVFSPTLDAEYPYRLTVEIRNYDGEDECEC